MSVPFNVTVVSGSTESKSFTITRVLDDQQIRFVLTWGSEASGAPSDLDSHLVGPVASGNTRFHTWYSDTEYYDGNTKYADLDVDDTDWEGPETTTIYSAVAGTYSFYIYDYTDQSDESSQNMSDNSSAVVNVYRGDQLLNTFHVPTGCSGNLWHVCDYDSTTGKVTSVNSVGYWPDGGSSTVGLTALEALKYTLHNKISSLEEAVAYLVDNTYKSDTQTLLNQAKSVYSDSEDEDTVKDMTDKLDEYISDLNKLWIDVSYQGTSYYGNFYNNSINISGLEDTLGDIKVTTDDSYNNLKVNIEDVTGQDYVKLITLTDTTTGAAKAWKVYYEYDITTAFKILGVTGDGVTDYYYSQNDTSVITIYKNRNTISNLQFTVMDGVTYTIGVSDIEDYDATLNMTYLDNTYKYYICYVIDSEGFGIFDIYGDEIVRYYIDYDDEDDNKTIYIYGTAPTLPEINIRTEYDDATAEVIDGSIIRVHYNDLYMDYKVSYTQLTALDILKEKLNDKIEHLEDQISCLADNDYKTDSQNFIKEAKSVYSDSEDENTIKDMISKLDERTSAINKLWIDVFYQGSSYYVDFYSNSINISGLEDTLGDIEVTTDDSYNNLKVNIEDVTGQDYVKLITLTDTATGAVRTWKVYYKYDVTAAFKILGVTGNGVTGYSDYDDDLPSITVLKDRSTISNLQFTVADGVTYTIDPSDREDYDAVVNMTYLDHTYKYYIRYINDPNCFYIYIYGSDIIRYTRDDDNGTVYIYGTTETLPNLNITTYYNGAKAELINNNSTIRVSCNDIYKDYNVNYTQLSTLETAKYSLNNKISSLEYMVNYLADNDYKTDTQNLIEKAKSVYSDSEDEDTVKDMISKLDMCTSAINKLWISVSYQGNYYYGGVYDYDIKISGLEDTLGNIKVITSSSSDNFNVKVEDVTDQDYVKLITLTDTATGAAKTWKVYYEYDVRTAFKILGISGDGFDSYGLGDTLITIYKTQSTVNNLKLTVMDGVTYTIGASDNEDYDAVVNMTYLDYTYKYYIRYEYSPSCFNISGIVGDGIIKCTSGYYDNKLYVYGTTATQPELGNITTYYKDAKAEFIDSSTIRVSYNEASRDYNISYIQITPAELKLDINYEFTFSSASSTSYASFTPDVSGYYKLSSVSENDDVYCKVYYNGNYYSDYNLSSEIYLNADTTYYFELHANISGQDVLTSTLCLASLSDTDSSTESTYSSDADAGSSAEVFGDGISDTAIEIEESPEAQDIESFAIDGEANSQDNEASVEIIDDEAVSDETADISVENIAEQSHMFSCNTNKGTVKETQFQRSL